MNPAPLTHRKLPGRSLTWRGFGRLWQGEDHLLEATSWLVLEQYRRFFFHETKAFIVQRTKVRLVLAWLEGGFGAVSILAGAAATWFGYSKSEEEWHPIFYVIGGIFGAVALVCLLLLAINLLLGPTCRCHILTTTGWHALAAPSRLGPAMQVQTRVFPLIEAAQERLPVAEAEVS